MTSLKKGSKTHIEIEKAVNAISKLPFKKNIIYKASRRFNDRIYASSRKDKPKKTKKSKNE